MQPTRAREDCLVLTGHLLLRTRITIARVFGTRRLAMINSARAAAGAGQPDGQCHPGHARGRCAVTLATADWTAADGRPGLRVELADTGPGLAEALIGELFKRFVTRKQDGTGLGLWISRSIRTRGRKPQQTLGWRFKAPKLR